MNLFESIDEDFDTAFVLRSRNTNRDDAGNECTTSLYSISANTSFGPISCGFMAVGD